MREPARPSVPKWPFYFGDLLLVATAILIAFKGGGALNGWQFFWVFACVAGGAALFALPFILEFRGELTLSQSRPNEFSKETGRRLHALIGEVQEIKETLSAMESHQTDTLTALESTISDVQVSLASIAEPRGGIDALTTELRKLTEATELLDDKTETEETVAEKEAPSFSMSEPVVLEAAQSNEPSFLDAPETLQGEAFYADEEEDDLGFGMPEAASEDLFLNDFTFEQDVVLPNHPVAQEVQREAANEAQEEPLSFQSEPEFEPLPADEPPLMETEASSSEETLFVDASMDAPFVLDELGPVGAGRDTSALVSAHQVITATETEPSVQAATTTLSQPVRRSHTGQTKLIAHVLTGIGKKPYIRGEGPGLSWDKGVPMDFVEIGKWQWVAQDASQPVKCRIYKDDQIAAAEGEFALEPGEQVEISPHFG